MPFPLAGPIALFDSGEGGLTVLRHLVERYPDERFLYAADSGHFPYGEKSLNDVRRWFLTFVDFFRAQGARAVIIACNTATAAALEEARSRVSVPVVGVVEAAVARAATVSENRRIGVLSTEATYQSGLYPTSLRAVDPGLIVVSKPCPVLVIMAENGRIEGIDVEAEVRQCITPVLAQEVDTIVLGCTHFPHMRKVFNRVVGDRVHIVDPGEEIVPYLTREMDLAEASGMVRPVAAWTTGDPARFTSIASKLCPHIPMVTRPLHWRGDVLVE